eukprot:scaffold236331_cov19-Tisochrysis_lutea.AAC.2
MVPSVVLTTGDQTQSQEWKHRLEERQRQDQRLRKEGGAHPPPWGQALKAPRRTQGTQVHVDGSRNHSNAKGAEVGGASGSRQAVSRPAMMAC